MPIITSRGVTRTMAMRHEALFVRLDALCKQVSAQAQRRPRSAVPEALRKTAEDLMFEARPFVPHVRGALPVAQPEFLGLSAQLDLVRAGLEIYEIERSKWNLGGKCFCWNAPGPWLPVKRHRPAAAEAQERANMEDLSKRLLQKIRELQRDRDKP
jgi:hypothetical protein